MMAGASADLAQAIEALALKDCCSHCGKQGGAALRCCTRCKQASYCGAECQKAAWKGHKKLCATLMDVIEQVNAASAASNWRGVLKWEGRMVEMMAKQPDANCLSILKTFQAAHELGFRTTYNQHHHLALVTLFDQQIELLCKMQRFRDQGEIMCTAAAHVMRGDGEDRGRIAAGYNEKARKIGEQHGFFSVESCACTGLGQLASLEGRDQEAADFLRNALAGCTLHPYPVSPVPLKPEP